MAGVMIVDASPSACDRVKQLICWKESGLVFLGEACDGNLALAQIRKLQPDIVVMEVDLPGLDGLTVIEKAKDDLSGTHFVLMSSSRIFEDARRACFLPVSAYLLKPLNRESLNSSLSDILSQISKEYREKTEMERLRRQISEQQNYILRSALREMYRDDFVWSQKDPYLIQGIPFKKEWYTILVVKFDIPYDARAACLPVIAYVRRLFETDAAPDIEIHCVADDNRLAVIVGHDREILPDLREKIVIADEYVKSSGYCKSSYGLSTPGRGAGQMDKLLMEALSAIELRRHRYTRTIRYDQSVPRIDRYRRSGQDIRLVIEDAVSQETFDPLKHFLEEREARLKEEEAEYCYPWFLMSVIHELGELLSDSDRAEFEEPLKRLAWEIDNEPKQYVIRCEMEQSFRDLFSRYLEYRIRGENLHIVKARAYIDRHYGEELSLLKVADIVHLNPAYFSNLFKSVTGVNFVDYVQHIRIEKGKEELITTGRKVEEIALQVGYLDKRHFSRIFKRIVGMNPQTYRKLYGRGEPV